MDLCRRTAARFSSYHILHDTWNHFTEVDHPQA